MPIDQNTLLIIISCIGGLTLVLLILVIQIYLRLKKFLVPIDANNIAESLQNLNKNIQNLEQFQNITEAYLKDVEVRLRKSIQSTHTVRFNPFQGTGEGGNQSFATAFLNENGDGAVISSIYTRDRVSVFAKAIKHFTSDYGMSEEEKEALEKAKDKLK
jgi:hypothetical protein